MANVSRGPPGPPAREPTAKAAHQSHVQILLQIIASNDLTWVELVRPTHLFLQSSLPPALPLRQFLLNHRDLPP